MEPTLVGVIREVDVHQSMNNTWKKSVHFVVLEFYINVCIRILIFIINKI